MGETQTENTIFAGCETREAGYIMPGPHCHGCFELFYAENGNCNFFIDNNMHYIHSGDFILIPPDVFHYTRYSGGPCRRCMAHFSRADLGGEIIDLLPGREKFLEAVRIFQLPEPYREQISGLFARMAGEIKLSDRCSAHLLRAMLRELFLRCIRECLFLEDIPEQIHTTDRQIVAAAQFISGHYSERIDAAEIAAAAGYSPNYLSRKFKKAVGIGVHEYLLFVRLKQAALELVTTSDSVTEIAFRCGFSDSNYFKDAFKKKYGVTPRAYRKT